MRIRGKRRLGILAHALVGALIGAALGLWLGRALFLRSAKIALSDYALQLTRHAEELTGEIDGVFRTANASGLAYCSDPDVKALQAQTFASRELKDIGRTREGKLYCSAFLGRLAQPYAEGTPMLVTASGLHIYTGVAVVLASAKADHATVFEAGDADAVLSPDAFDHWNRPRVGYMVAATRPGTRQLVPIAGSDLSADAEWASSPGVMTLNGALYSTRCSRIDPVCAVTTESLADVFIASKATALAYSAISAIAGLGLGFAVGLLYLRSIGLSSQLHRSLRKNSKSLQVVYQPIWDSHSRRLCGVEALLRWKDEDGEAVSPEIFIQMAEDKGFIGELTAFVVRRSIEQLGGLLKQDRGLALSINISAADLKGEHLFALLDKHVPEADLLPRQVILELTERSTADLGVVTAAIKRLRAKSYQVHIDDFGTGFSSLSYLEQLTVNAIKIDRSFTRTIGTGAVTASILPQVLAMAECLGLEVIVEGVETEEQTAYLYATGAPMKLQGWYFGRPMNAEALITFQEKSSARADWAECL